MRSTRDPLLPGFLERDLRRAARDAADGGDAARPLTPYGVAKAYGHFIAASYRRRYGMFTCCGILYNHESPRRPARLPAPQGRARGGGDLARPGARAGPRRSRRPPRLGLCGRLRARDVADAPAGRAGGLRRRDGRLALGRGARRRARSMRSVSTGAITCARTRPASAAGGAPRSRRRRLEGAPGARLAAGGRASTSSSALMVDAERRAASGNGSSPVDRSWARAVASHVNRAARSSPRGPSSSARASASTAPAAIAPGSCGSKRTAASPTTSGNEPALDAATGQPHAIASTGGRPNPS